LERQVQIEGAVELVDDKEADAYWATRPRESQIGAWASHQSQPLANRDDLLLEAKRIAEIYEGRDIPRPPRWSGFRVIPNRIEFWKGMPARLHERIAYLRNESGAWTKTLLNP
jgi:pyridoxamine 5'-phosphate oxidase